MLESHIELTDELDLSGLMPAYVNRREADLQQLQDALEQQNLRRIAGIASRIRGSGGAYGFTELAEQARLLQNAAEKNHMVRVHDIISDIKKLVDHIREELPA